MTMNHERCSESLGAWLRGELPASEAEEVAAHVEECADCARERDALGLLLALDVEPLVEEERARLERAVLAQRRAEVIAWAPTRPSWRARLAPALGAAALIALVAVGAVYVGLDGGADEDQAGAPEAVTGAAPTPTDDAGGDRQELRDRGNQMAGKREASQAFTSLDAEATRETAELQAEANEHSGAGTDSKSQPMPSSEGEEQADTAGGGGGSGGGGEPAPAPAEGQAKAAPETVSISPSSDTAEVGSCNPFVVRVTDKDGEPVQGVTLDVEQRHELAQDNISGNEPQVGFCTAGGPNPSAVDADAGDLAPPDEDPDNAGTAGGKTVATTNGKGRITIGVDVTPANGSDGSGDVALVAFVDETGDDDPDSGEPQDTATNTWVASEQRSSFGESPRVVTGFRWVASLLLGIF
jgi:anti-sigma factor RsiW